MDPEIFNKISFLVQRKMKQETQGIPAAFNIPHVAQLHNNHAIRELQKFQAVLKLHPAIILRALVNMEHFKSEESSDKSNSKLLEDEEAGSLEVRKALF